MTTQRWRQISDLFDAALRLEPAERGDWVRGACGADDELRAELDRLLADDDEASRTGFLTPPDTPRPAPDPTASWPPHAERPQPASISQLPGELEPDVRGFPQKAAIAAASVSQPTTETRSVLQSRLFELAVIYLLIFGMAFFWRHVILRRYDVTISSLHVVSLLALGGAAYLFHRQTPMSMTRLRALELTMIGMMAIRVAFAQYWLMLSHSQHNDPMAAQRTMQNHVLLVAILILTSGIYVPKSWRRAALVGVPLALLPFATLLLLRLRHPEAMGWLARRGASGGTAPIGLYSYDCMLLLTLAVGAAWGANTISRLRRQVVEARQLGQYRLRRRIGAGGMGEVYLADHQLLKRPCAVKLIRPDDAADPKALERFEREVRITATLSHWNTVEIYDYGRTEEGTYYYVMEYLPGLSLAELVEHHGPQPAGRVVYLLRQVCNALREAHAAGLIHRDIKPSNIFAARRGGVDDVAKLLDFGLVLPLVTTGGPRPAQEARALGTPLHMSPEQALGHQELDARSDIYSLGTVAYFLLTGAPPFAKGNGFEVMMAHTRARVAPMSQAGVTVPEDLERIVLRCLAKDPADRYQDAEALEHALSDCGCVGEWDQAQAALWWRQVTSEPAACVNSACG
ncbi:MAG: serine/threonine-protein kinase [Isosphaeraceae bacterium]|nr:serine/threonine-protein kinase [Isosphaeraceae bacterium]